MGRALGFQALIRYRGVLCYGSLDLGNVGEGAAGVFGLGTAGEEQDYDGAKSGGFYVRGMLTG